MDIGGSPVSVPESVRGYFRRILQKHRFLHKRLYYERKERLRCQRFDTASRIKEREEKLMSEIQALEQNHLWLP